jgi:predicted ATPase/serine phosphatase RsbU (regulator of sigma subunit)
MLTVPHYQIDTQIYESVNSLVYRGIRKKDNQPVILKMLKQDYPTPLGLTRYRQEYEITHDLDLAGVIKVYGIEKYQNTLVIILEDLGGESLKQLMADRPFTLKEFLPIAIQIADSLGQIHAANVIHKDINPSNIVWEPISKQLKIIDFGIASRLPRENPTLKNPEQLEGTLAYLSPEQTGRINRSMDYRTDLYSFGITCYEMLTGFVPFDVFDAMELVHCHIAKTPTPVYEINPDVPAIVSDIVMKLMEKNAEDRYQSAFGVKADLQECKLQFAKTAHIEIFSLAQNDFSGKLQIPQKLYGRQNEVNTLLQAFERVCNGKAEMMLVAGYSGVGKSALVQEVHKQMTKKRGYFAAGKFDQFQKNIPYSALTTAFNEFCNYLLTESTEQLKQWQKKILGAVRNNGQILVDVIPHLELIIGQQAAVAQVGPQEAQNRFNLVFQNFFRAIAQKIHPLVLFIDDLQWADLASLNLLKTLMSETENQYFLIIGAYRDNEVDATHPLMMMLEEFHQRQATVKSISLANLSSEEVNSLMAEALRCEPAHVETLTNLVYEKTQGNAFFTHEFLKSLYEEELLVFEVKEQKWQWEISKIAAKNMSDNVVELMANKIEKCPIDTITVLKLAASIGNQFDLETLSIIYQHSQQDTLAHLWKAVEESLVLPLDEHYKCLEQKMTETTRFKFQHDRIQQATYSLIEENQRQSLHLQIGRLLLDKIHNVEKILFDIVNQFNNSLSLVDDEAEKRQLAELNLMAGQKAKAAAAYKLAFFYLKTGIELLKKEAWQQAYSLTLQLHTEAAEAAYLNADFVSMENEVQIVLQQAQTLQDKVKVYEVQIQANVAQNQSQQALTMALKLLKQLEVHFPEQPSHSDIQNALLETASYWHGKQIEDLRDLPLMTAPDKLVIMRLLSKVAVAAYIALPELYPLIITKLVSLSLTHGNAEESSFGYVGYGLLLCAIVEDIEAGFKFGQLALTLVEQLNAKSLQAKIADVVEFAIRHWKEHLKSTLKPLLEDVYQTGIDTGEMIFGGFGPYLYCFHSYLMGRELLPLEQEMVTYNHKLVQIKQEITLNYNEICHQAVLNLMKYNETSTSSPRYLLMGEAYNEKKMLSFHQQVNDKTGLAYLYFHKLILSYLFRAYPQAVENATMVEKYLEALLGSAIVPVFYFYDSLARLAIYSQCMPPEKKRFLDKITANQAKMNKWATYAPMNYLHKFYLVEAERYRVLGKDGEAREFYDKAITLAQQHEYRNEEALAHELAGQFYLVKGQTQFAKVCLYNAHSAYQQWGAMAKVKDLEEQYSEILAQKSIAQKAITLTLTDSAYRSQLHSTTQLDFDSVMKASSTLSGEIVLNRLLEKMMHIVIENAGAEKGFLILPQLEQWFIEAESRVDSAKIKVLQSLPVENNVAVTIVQYVAHSQENVVLDNASRQGHFTSDPYIIAHQSKSILCAPLLNHGKLIGILYLENNVTEGAFTPNRLEVVKILSSQAAVSLENALLYQTLEKKVAQRTEELAEANQAIRALNKQLQSENLRMSAELEVSRQLQQMLLPKDEELEAIDGLDIACFMEPANEVGGDYYDVLYQDGRILIGIGDVTGHGLESGALAIMVQSGVRALLASYQELDSVKFLSALNQMVYHNVQRMNAEKSMTLALLSYQQGELVLTGQHEEMILVRADGQLEQINTIDLGFMIGLEQDIAYLIAETHKTLNHGDVVVLYTDGITEAENTSGCFYGLERLCQIVQDNWQKTAQEIQEAVIDDVRQFIGEQRIFDDITLLVLKQQ